MEPIKHQLLCEKTQSLQIAFCISGRERWNQITCFLVNHFLQFLFLTRNVTIRAWAVRFKLIGAKNYVSGLNINILFMASCWTVCLALYLWHVYFLVLLTSIVTYCRIPFNFRQTSSADACPLNYSRYYLWTLTRTDWLAFDCVSFNAFPRSSLLYLLYTITFSLLLEGGLRETAIAIAIATGAWWCRRCLGETTIDCNFESICFARRIIFLRNVWLECGAQWRLWRGHWRGRTLIIAFAASSLTTFLRFQTGLQRRR